MKIEIVFDKSGDTIAYDAVNHDVLEHYIGLLESNNNNKFYAHGSIVTINDIAKNLHNSLVDSNQILKQLDLTELSIPADMSDYFNQRTLNLLHEQWALKQYEIIDIRKNLQNSDTLVSELAETLFHMLPDDNLQSTLAPLLYKISRLNLYESINTLIHRLEDSFAECRFKSENFMIIKHDFDKNKILSNSRMHLRLSFEHLGRTLYNKFLRQDNKLEFKDENNFNELVGYVDLSFEKFQTTAYSKEFITWCTENKRQPLGQYLNFGHLPDLDERLHEYRLILSRNIINNNFFTLQLNKGN